MGLEKDRSMTARNQSSGGGMLFNSGATEAKSRRSKSAPSGKAWNFAPIASMRSRRTLPDRKAISWPSAIKMPAIASSGLRWPVAGVEAMRIFMGPVPLVVEKEPSDPDELSDRSALAESKLEDRCYA